MRAEQKASVKNSVGRLVFVFLSVVIQVGWIIVLFLRLNAYSTTISMCSSILALLVVLRIYGTNSNAAFKMPWIILILVFPVLGLCIFALFGHSSYTRKMHHTFHRINEEISPFLLQKKETAAVLEEESRTVSNQCRYIRRSGNYPVYQNTQIEFYGEASDGFNAQIEALEKAEKFIFMEYHAIEEGEAFARLKEVLTEKARAGVEVRVFYDEIGSVGFIDRDFIKRMEEKGIKCRVFNPIIPILNVFMNNRDHRKITVIDGTVGFTGGYNLADEYFNITHPYGYWKDTGIKMTGDAVQSLTALFLEMWNAMDKTDESYENYFVKAADRPESNIDQKTIVAGRQLGFVQPYGETPLRKEPLAENVYLNLIKSAKYSLYVVTPYLIISDEMIRELGLAAKRGVDVRILTPGIPDKKMIYGITRSYYASLAVNGVRIYEYTPGFVHAKEMISDNRAAVIGTINMDYRSLYHHFENGVFLYGCSAISDMTEDFNKSLSESREVTSQYQGKRSTILRIGQCILRLFAPLL